MAFFYVDKKQNKIKNMLRMQGGLPIFSMATNKE